MKKRFVKQAKLPRGAYNKPLNEVLSVYGVKSFYSLIDYGDGKRCGWCNKLVSEIGKENLGLHSRNCKAKGGEQNGKKINESY